MAIKIFLYAQATTLKRYTISPLARRRRWESAKKLNLIALLSFQLIIAQLTLHIIASSESWMIKSTGLTIERREGEKNWEGNKIKMNGCRGWNSRGFLWHRKRILFLFNDEIWFHSTTLRSILRRYRWAKWEKYQMLYYGWSCFCCLDDCLVEKRVSKWRLIGKIIQKLELLYEK